MKNIFKKSNYEKYYKDLLPYLKEEKNQKYLTIILTFGASIFFLLFAINPTLSTISKLRKQISDSRFVEQRLSAKINSLSSLSQAYQNILPDIVYVKDAIPENPDGPILIAQIQAVAQNSSVDLRGVNIAAVNLTKATTSSNFNFDINAHGEYENVIKFLTDLIDIQRIVSVDTISIAKDPQGDSGVDLNVKGSAYYKKP